MCSFIDACQQGNIETVNSLIHNAKLEERIMGMKKACMYGQVEVARLLLVDPIVNSENSEFTILAEMSENKESKKILRLLNDDLRAKIDAHRYVGAVSGCGIHSIVTSGDRLTCINELIETARCNNKDYLPNGKTILNNTSYNRDYNDGVYSYCIKKI